LLVRPYWKGYLKLALVSCPIALHAACSTAERIAFRQVNKATGNRLRQQLIDEETLEPVAPEHKGRGYEVAKRASESQTGRRRTRAQADGCRAAPGDQSHGGAAPQCRRGRETSRAAHGNRSRPGAQTGMSVMAPRQAMSVMDP
jgi:hypothetical protein